MKQAVIIAGGKGTRLKPYTDILPKPLLPIGNKSILETNIIQLVENGITEIIIALGYLGYLIKNILGKGENYGVNIRYTEEEKPLGTVGALSLSLDLLDNEFIILNGDMLHNFDYLKAHEKFYKEKADILITVVNKCEKLSLGVLIIKNDTIVDYQEKPKSEYSVSAGMYIMQKKIVKKYVLKNVYCDFPNLINLIIKDGGHICPYYHKGLWIDLGTKNEYIYVLENMENIISKYPEIPITK